VGDRRSIPVGGCTHQSSYPRTTVRAVTCVAVGTRAVAIHTSHFEISAKFAVKLDNEVEFHSKHPIIVDPNPLVQYCPPQTWNGYVHCPTWNNHLSGEQESGFMRSTARIALSSFMKSSATEADPLPPQRERERNRVS